MDAFYASIEQRDNPGLRGKPVAVGGDSDRGVVAAASYEARKFGVKSALSSKVAKRKCPGLVFVYPRFEVYKAVSKQIHEIFHSYTDLVEPLSLDEAFLDVTFTKLGPPSATLIAREIKKKIKAETGLVASAGVSYNKFLAKIASDMDKPDGLYVITPEEAISFLEKLEVRKFFGVGKVTAKKLNNIGVWFGRELKQLDKMELNRLFGKAGGYYYDVVRGVDNRPVMPTRKQKSIGAENTFSTDLYLTEQLIGELDKIRHTLWRRIERSGKFGRTLTLKIKYSDFEQITRSKTSTAFITSSSGLMDEARLLLKKAGPLPKGVRLLGLSVSNFEKTGQGPVQLTLDF